jgi:D-cysteine desulfhydrase
MDLARFPRRRYTPYITPIERMHNLSAHLKGPQLYVKRDDVLGLAGGGNKTRKLEFLVADAINCEADTLITTGAVQSNHCRLTLAAAVKEGMRCRLILEERVPGSYAKTASGNNFLYRLLGVEEVTVVQNGTDLALAMQGVSEELVQENRKGYILPGGGSNPLGALGYVACANEILQQSFESGISFDRLVVASGSGGTHAGLVTGLHANSSPIPITGVSTRADNTAQENKILALAQATGELVGTNSPIPEDSVSVTDAYVGSGYSLPTDGTIEAIRLFAELEGILLDPVYTGKAAAGLIDLIRKGIIGPEETVLFVHTGGSPALYAYLDTFLG